MNGYVKSTHYYRRISNLIEQIPMDVRMAVATECIPDNGDIHEWERRLTCACLRKEWDTDAGTRFIISGGEVLELDSHIDDGIDEIPF